jgi:excisionase family DNA binding protein
LLTPEEVAARLAISVKSVYRLVGTRPISSVRVGGLLRFIPDDLAAYIERHSTASADTCAEEPT